MPCYLETVEPPSREEYERWRNMGYIGSWDDYCSSREPNVGSRVFVCGNLGDHCAECMAVGDLLCDFPVGDGKTCDRPMCANHAHEIGPDLHYCQAHYAMWQEFKERGGVDAALRNVVAFKCEK